MGDRLTVIARMKAKPGMEERLKQELLSLLQPTRAEEGCINYDLHQSMQDGSRFLFHENWESEECLKKHSQSEHLKSFRARVGEMLDGPTEIEIWKAL
ncbi:MAG TPA: putative quinol monooxygenase [Blastocatellia bacterium]|jgi:quinol monooxygenase YgiN|nr:putative quinol monooxygenase [Blastocatellia bacterium]